MLRMVMRSGKDARALTTVAGLTRAGGGSKCRVQVGGEGRHADARHEARRIPTAVN